MGKKKKEVAKPQREFSRKELRKEKRMMKKQAKSKFFEARRMTLNKANVKSGDIIIKDKLENKTTKPTTVPGKQRKPKSKLETSPAQLLNPEKKSYTKLLDKMKEQRKRQLIEANKQEEKEIKSLEKKLKLTDKKSVSKSKGFAACGLDYILEVIDPDRIKDAVKSEVNLEDSDSDFFEDYQMIQNKSELKKNNSDANPNPKRKKVRMADDSSELKDLDNVNKELADSVSDNTSFGENAGEEELSVAEDVSEQEGSDLSSSGDENYDSDSQGSEKDITAVATLNEGKKVTNKPKVWEDIYGRMRDAKGNVIKTTEGKYVPPHLRDKDDSAEEKKKRELLRQLKGLLNRLALNNISSIANQIEELYSKNSRHSMNEALYELYLDSLVSPIMSPETIVIDHSMLISVLHANIGSEVGAYFLQNLVHKFNSMLYLSQTVENKSLDNLIFLISYLYNFKLFEACLMYDILNKLCDQFTEKNIDLILITLKNVGFSLRKDDPNAMKAFLLKVQKQVNQTTNVEDRTRMKYMLEVLLSIKNNNISKLSDFDPEHHEHLKKVLKSVIRSGNSLVPLRIGLEDLLKAEERGRWWIVGSAWSKGDDEAGKSIETFAPMEEFSAQLLALAKKQRMNTDNRRNIFCILISAEDYHDAFEKLLKLGLKGQQEREIPLVLIHCLLQEKHYNPYYAHIADQLCISNRRHQMSLQCALWDRFRALEKLSTTQINSLAKFVAQLVLAGSIPISVLKVVEFTELDKRHIRLLRQTILAIASDEGRDSVSQVFMKVSQSKKLSLFREALRLFIHHFILRNMPEGELKERVTNIGLILSGDIS